MDDSVIDGYNRGSTAHRVLDTSPPDPWPSALVYAVVPVPT